MEMSLWEVSDPYYFDLPYVFNHMGLRHSIVYVVYHSFELFPGLAAVLTELEQRNGTSLGLAREKGEIFPAECDGPTSAYNFVLTKYTTACNDVTGRFNVSSVELFQDHVTELKGTSKYIGTPWARTMTLYCRKLRFSPPKSQEFLGYKEINTINLILLNNNNNKIDPVTPSLESVIEFFPGAGSFYHDAIGHGFLIMESN
ncbi:hypothetical protein BU25DRAFT_458673 [Macroventuria anomochaeta]|uniref:Uncharacterized protein n=1 Tax=Macroventuria anomochaeta TaxID=301207 RepID=A0ACB6RZB9_9PLEO|nr:uncharacterized protein BU25DRAFT_458673 [Macroventuria anomochaeta]KAF2627330.1 hypothetical protein BU25DRAFT_458673 [Macroventuria anomochaeta]